MAFLMFSMGKGCGKVGFGRGEEVSLQASRRVGLCRRWDGGCRDGHGSWRGEGSAGEGGTPVPWKSRAFTVSWDMVERRIADRSPPFPFEGTDQLPVVVAGEEQGCTLLQAGEKVVGEILNGNKMSCAASYLSLPVSSCGTEIQTQGLGGGSSGCTDDGCWRREDSGEGERPMPWFTRRTLMPLNAAPLKRVTAGYERDNRRDTNDAPVKAAGLFTMPSSDQQVTRRDQVPAAAEGDSPVARRKRRFPAVLYCGRVRKVARRTVPVDGPPLKKAPPWTHQRQDPTGLKGASAAASPCPDAGEGGGRGGAGMLPAQHCICRRVDAYELLNKVGAGTYGVVFRARDRETGEVVALKKVRIDDAVIGEISILASLRLRHPGIVGLKEVVFDVGGRLEDGVYLVMEYAEYDLHRVIKGMKRPFDQSEAKFLMQQLLQAVQCIHGCGVLHRDLKASNVLVTRGGQLKLCDFGLSRRCSGGIGDQRPYTNWVGTRWYRAPELLLKDKKGYSAAIDMWSVGCVMAELLSKAPLFPGKNELDQLHQIFGVLGTPDEGTWPGFAALCEQRKVGFACRQPPRGSGLRERLPPSCLSEAGYDLLMGLLTYDPSRRMTAEQALHHEWFREFPPPTALRFEGGESS